MIKHFYMQLIGIMSITSPSALLFSISFLIRIGGKYQTSMAAVKICFLLKKVQFGIPEPGIPNSHLEMFSLILEHRGSSGNEPSAHHGFMRG